MNIDLGPSRLLDLNHGSGIQLDSNQIPIGPLRRAGKPVEVKEGSVTVQIWPQVTRFKSRGKARRYRTHLIVWRDANGRHRERRGSLEKAKVRAKAIAIAIVRGQSAMANFGEDDRATYAAALGNLPPGASLVLCTAEQAECLKILGGRCTPAEACRDYVLSHPAGIDERKIPAIVTDLLNKRAVSAKYKRNLKKMLERFAAKFDCPLSALQPRDIDDWLDSLCAERDGRPARGLTTRRNHRTAVQTLVNYAKTRGYVRKDWDTMAQVSNPEPAPATVDLYTPDELVRLLNKAETYTAGKKLVPLIAITAFAGVRHGEMNEEKKLQHLDWSDIDWDAKRIYIARAAAKTGKDRTVDMPDNLIAWLQPYARKSGKICSLKRTSTALCRLREKAGIVGSKRNALRKSFISYQVALARNIEATADQAGNSPAVIRRNYKRTSTTMRESAARWFAIMPTRADVLPLFQWARAQ